MNACLKRGVVIVFISCLVSTAAFSQEQTAYENWAQFQPESFVTYKLSTETVGVQTETQMTYTLTEVTPDKVVLQLKTVTETMGMKVEKPDETIEIEKEGGTMPTAVVTEGVEVNISDAVESGTKIDEKKETVEVNGQEIEALVITVETESAGQKTTVTLWSSDEFPGQTIKSLTQVGGLIAVKAEMAAIDFNAIQ